MAARTPKQVKRILNRNEADTYMTDYEMNATVHGIAQLKKDFPRLYGGSKELADQEWETITFKELLGIDPAIRTTYERIKHDLSPKDLMRWKKLLLSRLAREGLLGRRMKFSNL